MDAYAQLLMKLKPTNPDDALLRVALLLRMGCEEIAEAALEGLYRRMGKSGGFTTQEIRIIESNLAALRERKLMPPEHQLGLLSAQLWPSLPSPPLPWRPPAPTRRAR